MAQRARTNKNTSLATSNGSGYNKKNGGSYTGSTTGLSAEKSPLNTQKTDFTAPKKTTITPKKTEENYFQKARETQRELSKPLPRINDAPKKDESNFSLSTGSAQKKENPFTDYFSKKLNLPSREERNFAMGAIGEESERAAYNDGVVEEFEKAGYLKNTKTQDDLFHEGFEGVKKPDVYEFTSKADDNVQKSLYEFLDYGKTPKSRMEAFSKIRDENAEQSAKPQFHAAYKPENKKVELDPNITMLRKFDAKNTVKPIGGYDPSKTPAITQHFVFQKNSSGIKPFTKDFNNNIFTSWKKQYTEKCNGIEGIFNTDYYYAEKDGKRYRANSEETVRLYDWTSIDETFLDGTLERLINEANQKPTGMGRILSQSVGGDLDFKLKLDENKLYLANGVLYNKNEAGNFIWAYFLESKKVSGRLSGALAQAGSKLPPLAKMDGVSRWDEEWDVKARWAGVKYYYEKNNLMWLYEELYGDSPKI